MRRFRMLLLTLTALVALDLSVAAMLSLSEAGPMAKLARYFDYGRSIPGKIERWRRHPDMPGNLLNVAWRPDIVADSARRFAGESGQPLIRAYGMSFSNDILGAAHALDPALQIDTHAGPSAPPNFVYALFQDDRANRREGDVVVFGVLASTIHAMAAYSNSAFAFEQPAPMTYPVYEPTPEGLLRRDPVAETPDQALSDAFVAQLAAEDPHYSAFAFRFRWADRSPFLRLTRRALMSAAIVESKADILSGRAARGVDVRGSLRGVLAGFVESARRDGQTPIVLLIQNRPRRYFDLSTEAGPTLDALGALYLDTATLVDPDDWRSFLPDGHFTAEANQLFGQALLTLLRRD